MNTPTSIPWSADVETPVSDHERIAIRAQEIWRELGCPKDQDLAIWLEAEAELSATDHKVLRHPHRPGIG